MSDIEKNPEKMNDDLNAQMLEAISCGVFAYTYPEREVITANAMAKQIMECDDEDLKGGFGDYYFKRIIPEDHEHIVTVVSRLNKTGDSVGYTYHVKKKNGKIIVVHNTSRLLEFSNGRQYILTTLIDITKQANLDKLLAKEREQYRNAVLDGAELSFSIDLTEGYLYDSMKSKDGDVPLSRFGLKAPTAYGDIVERWMRIRDLVPFAESSDDIMYRDVLLDRYAGGEKRVTAEYYSARYDKYYDILILLSEIQPDKHVRAIFIAYDITEKVLEEQRQKKQLLEVKESLSRANEDLEQSLKSEKEKTDIVSALSTIYYSNYLIDLRDESIVKIYGSGYLEKYFDKKGEVRATFKSWMDEVLADNDREETEAFLEISTLPKRMRWTQIISHECVSRKDGWIRVSFIAVERDSVGNVLRVMLAAQHVEEAKKKELTQQEALKTAYASANKANSAKTDFLARMSHDIRTPMNAIMGMTAIAGNHLDEKERVADCLAKINTSSKHLLGLINEVLDMSKIESGKVDLYNEEFSLPELIDNMLSMVKPQVQEKRHELSVSIHNIEHENVIGDSQRIQQSFMNLMSNAIKYTPMGGKLALTISEKPVKIPNVGCYEFIFEDNGIGMSEEYMEHLFDPFTRATDSRVESIQGTGLGMAITRNLVQMMNGDIKVESELDKGTRFTVTIALKLQNGEEAIDYDGFTGLPVLVVDDDRLSCETTCEVLHELGMSGEWVLSGKEAVDLVVDRNKEEKDFFAVIIDWKMPGMDGIQVVKKLREAVGDKLKIIILSSYDWSDIEEEAREAGVNVFMNKPLFKSRMAYLFNGLLGNGGYNDDSRMVPLHEILEKDFEGKRALLVEDNELNAEIAEEILGMAGIAVEHAMNGKEAVDIMRSVKEGYFDVIFMDVQMPIMNGYEATRAIRKLPGSYAKEIPIIAMTANAFTDDIQAASESGMNQHLSKPLDMNELKSILYKWLQ